MPCYANFKRGEWASFYDARYPESEWESQNERERVITAPWGDAVQKNECNSKSRPTKEMQYV